MGLQNAFYIVGLVYMGIMLVLVVAILVAVLVIKSKINRVHRMIDDKVNSLRGAADKVATALRTVQYFLRR